MHGSKAVFHCRDGLVRCGEHLADFLHFPADKLLGEFRVMAGHVRIGVAENLRQHIYRHPVFHRKTRERVAGAVRCQRLVDIADHSYLFQITV